MIRAFKTSLSKVFKMKKNDEHFKFSNVSKLLSNAVNSSNIKSKNLANTHTSSFKCVQRFKSNLGNSGSCIPPGYYNPKFNLKYFSTKSTFKYQNPVNKQRKRSFDTDPEAVINAESL